jgi:RHS repeat-associated protein
LSLHRNSNCRSTGEFTVEGTWFSRNAASDKRIDFTYTADSRFDEIDRYADLAGTKLVAKTNYTYDDAGRLTNLNHAKGATTFADYSWTFDSAGRLTQQAFTDYLSNTNTSDYSYDDTGQLTAADHDYQSDESYTYDDNGNRVSGNGDSYTTGDHNRMTTDGTYTYSYDAEGNRIARFIDADSSGTLNTGDTDITEYEWDHSNRLIGVTEYATYGGSVTQDVDYVYDLNQRLIKRTIDADGAGAGTTATEHFVYDGNQIIFTFDESATGDQLTHRYLWGPQVDQLIVDETVASDGSTDTVNWALTDHLGSVRDLVQYDATLDATSVVGHYVYDAFGQVNSHTGAATSIFLFTGRYREDATDLQWNLNRWYDPATGKWISEDPIGFSAGDANLCRYVENTPISHTDPTGKKIVLDMDVLDRFRDDYGFTGLKQVEFRKGEYMLFGDVTDSHAPKGEEANAHILPDGAIARQIFVAMVHSDRMFYIEKSGVGGKVSTQHLSDHIRARMEIVKLAHKKRYPFAVEERLDPEYFLFDK